MENLRLCLRLLPHTYVYIIFLHLPQYIPRVYEQVSRTQAMQCTSKSECRTYKKTMGIFKIKTVS